MIYREAVQIPAGTLRGVPYSQTLELTPGSIDNVQITFPSGCAGFVGLRIRRGLFQLYPLTVGEWLVSDDFTIVFPEEYKLAERPYSLEVVGYNEDDTYPHTIHVQISVKLPEDLTSEILDALQTQIPANLQAMLATGVEIRRSAEASVTILQSELVPILRALLDSQTQLSQRLISEMSLDELTQL